VAPSRLVKRRNTHQAVHASFAGQQTIGFFTGELHCRVLDAGFEVVYTGLFQTPTLVAEAALQEDADAVGLSVLSGAHMTLIPAIMNELRARALDDVLVFAGGIIPEDDRPALEAAGVVGVFTPGTQLPDIVAWLAGALDRRERQLTA